MTNLIQKTIDIKTKKKIIISESGQYQLNILSQYANININNDIEVEIFEHVLVDSKINYQLGKAEVKLYNFVNDNSLEVNIDNNGKLEYYCLDLGNKSKVKSIIDLNEYEASLMYSLMSYADKDNDKAYALKVNHNAVKTVSDFYNFGVIDDEAHISVKVTSFIAKGMAKSSAHQHTRAISLNKNAKATLDPILLIDEFDVSGGHGASFGLVNENDLYYMQSRGIKLDDAKKYLAIGTLLSKLPEDKIEMMKELVERRIDNE